MRVVLATANPGKVDELRSLLSPLGFDVVGRPSGIDPTVEDRATLEGNALEKAYDVARFTEQFALSDDTGLFVDALDGGPGVHTARYGGWERLLDELVDVPQADRSARFRTVLVLARPGDDVVVEGVCEGSIAAAPAGGGGFGYDPVFVPREGDGRTFAEMSTSEKNAISHRGRALRELVAALRVT